MTDHEGCYGIRDIIFIDDCHPGMTDNNGYFVTTGLAEGTYELTGLSTMGD